MLSSIRPSHAFYAIVLIAIGVVGLRSINSREPANDAAAASAKPPQIQVRETSGQKLAVHVAGEVRRPGVYRLAPSSRVVDALKAAGGAKPRADLSALNLAAKLEDGRQVLVPARGTPSGSVSTAVGTTSAGSASTKVNLNTATAEQLDQLDGVGPGTARKIIQYRTEKGGFSSVDELGEVPGIGEKRLATLREQVAV